MTVRARWALVAVLVGCGDDGTTPPPCDHVDLDGAARAHALPTGYSASAFRALTASRTCGEAGLPSHVTADTTGDGALDLIVTRLCGDATVGDTRWIVHPGGADGFGPAATWTLPGGYVAGSFGSTAGESVCGPAGLPTFTTLDLTGDGRLDLVVTRLCGDATVGETRWIVHPGQADGFGPATTWALPSGYLASSFIRTAGQPVCGGGALPSFVTTDVTGDRRADLVVTALCSDGTVGDTRWIVHPGGAGGFGAAASWALPGGYTAAAFRQLAAAPTCGGGPLPTYVTTDLVGDRHADLVLTARCDDGTVGDTRWVVHPGGDAGFGAATSFTLPAGYSASAFRAIAQAPTCGGGALPTYATFDLTGDERADLVVTARCDDGTVGDTRWVVHPGGDAGFGAADPVALPAGYTPSAFRSTAQTPTCGGGALPTYTTTDVDGDGRPDLLVTARCDDGSVGDTRWLVHLARCRT